jgi:hypothetical protein
MRRTLFLIVLLGCSVLLSACYGASRNPALLKLPKFVPLSAAVQADFSGLQPPASESCAVRAVDLLGAWTAAGAPEKDPFAFSDVDGKPCQGVFDADILPLFTQANLWYAGAISCRTCHQPDVTVAYGRMNLSDYQGIMAGSGRDSADTKGEDILGGGIWEQSSLYKALTSGAMPPNPPAGQNPKGPLVYAGLKE